MRCILKHGESGSGYKGESPHEPPPLLALSLVSTVAGLGYYDMTMVLVL